MTHEVVLATASAAPVLTAIAAAASVATGLILAVLAWRAQSAAAQLEEIKKAVDRAGERTVEQVEQALRDVIGTHPSRRRWYE